MELESLLYSWFQSPKVLSPNTFRDQRGVLKTAKLWACVDGYDTAGEPMSRSLPISLKALIFKELVKIPLHTKVPVFWFRH